ncbi:MAG: O-antigen polymerase, partial [Sphingopyxis sp.]|nr:O-antigen polymerase [Sphingopyxis sp.]
MALGFAVILFLMGGGSRDDIASLPLLRPLAVALLTAAIIAAPADAWTPYRWPLMALGAAALVVALQLVPLPPAMWQALPGRDIIIGIDRLAGLDGTWRPLNMAPSRGWNALFALAVPAAMLAVMIKAGEDAWAKLPVVLVLVGLGSGVLGALQLLSPGDGPLYLYRITNNDAAVGLFANRNHNAMFIACQFPLIAYV